MARAFADMTFTQSVKAAQDLYGSRAFNQRFEMSGDARNKITATDAEFITSRDSFYQSSVGENGWPYVQHRGGPVGFLKVLDEHTIGYADFRGNKQYISVGNIFADARVCLFLMDYAHRQRLKIWGHAKIIHEAEDAELISSLRTADYGAAIERAVIIQIDALEWNCSKHITPRFTEEEIKHAFASVIEENKRLKSRLARYEQ